MTALDIDAGGIAVMDSGERIFIYPGEGADDDCFAGEMLNPPEKMARLGVHVSCCWDRSKVIRIDPTPKDTPHAL